MSPASNMKVRCLRSRVRRQTSHSSHEACEFPLTRSSFSFILSAVPRHELQSGGCLLSPTPDPYEARPLSGQLVVFTGKLSSLSRKAARELVAQLGGAAADE